MMRGSLTSVLDSFPDTLWQANGFIGQVRHNSLCWRRPAHTHPDYVIEYVDKGRLTLSLSQTAVKRLDVNPNEYLLLPPEQEHQHELLQNSHTIFLVLPSAEVQEVCTELGLSSDCLHINISARATNGLLLRCLQQVVGEIAASSLGSALVLESLRIQVLIYLLRSAVPVVPDQDFRLQSLSPAIRNALDYLHSYYLNPLSLDQLAAVAMMGKFHFLRTFKQEVGLTPAAYWRRLRLEEAASLLKNSELSITEISYRLGFANPSHFNTAFRQAFGAAPSAFRRKFNL